MFYYVLISMYIYSFDVIRDAGGTALKEFVFCFFGIWRPGGVIKYGLIWVVNRRLQPRTHTIE